MRLRTWPIAFIAPLVWSAAAAAEPVRELLLLDARIVDPESETIESGNLLIRDGRIAGRPETAPEGFVGRRLDLEGRWVIPGLSDLHTHSYGNMAPGNVFDAPGVHVIAQRMLYAGQTAFLDLFGNEQTLYELRERQRAGEAAGADLFASLSCLTAPRGHCTEYGVPTRVMASPEEARRQVSELAAKRADVVKIVYAPTGRMPSIDRATLAAAVATASEHGIRTVIHVNTWDDVRDAVEVGASAVTHVPQEPMPEGLARRMAERGVASIPTLAVQLDFAYLVGDSEVLASPLARALAPQPLLDAYRDYEPSERAAEHARGREQRERRILASVRTMAEAGVTMLAGTDAGNYGTLQGFSIHRELEKMVQAGLTPWQALAAATTAAGDFLGRRWGVAVGDEANLVVLAGSPIDDVRNTQRIVHVVHRGRVVDREALLAAAAEPPG